MTWRHRFHDLDREAVEGMGDDHRRLTGEGWRVLAVAACVFGLGAAVFAGTGDWWPGIPAAVGAVFLGSEARRMRQRWRSHR